MGAPVANQEPVQSSNGGAAPASNPPTPAAAPAAPSASTLAPTPEAPWYAGFTDPEIRGYAEMKGLKSPEDTVKSYREAEKMLGGPREELVRIPKNATPEQLAEVYERLGTPKTVADYKIPQIDNANPVFTEKMANLLHQAKLAQWQMDIIAPGYNGITGEMLAEQQKAEADQVAADMVRLHQKWGRAFDERMAFADKAIQAGGLSEEQIMSIKGALDKDGQPGNAAALEALAQIGENFREAAGVFNDSKPIRSFAGKTLEGLEAELTQRIGNGMPGTADKMFTERIRNNDPQALQELKDLNVRIAQMKDDRNRG